MSTSQLYIMSVSVTGLATGASTDKSFEALGNDSFWIEDIRSEFQLNAAVAGVGPAGMPLALDPVPTGDNSNATFKSQVGLLFSVGTQKWQTASVPSTLITSDARRPGPLLKPQMIKSDGTFKVTITNNTGRTIDGTVLVIGQRRSA